MFLVFRNPDQRVLINCWHVVKCPALILIRLIIKHGKDYKTGKREVFGTLLNW